LICVVRHYCFVSSSCTLCALLHTVAFFYELICNFIRTHTARTHALPPASSAHMPVISSSLADWYSVTHSATEYSGCGRVWTVSVSVLSVSVLSVCVLSVSVLSVSVLSVGVLSVLSVSVSVLSVSMCVECDGVECVECECVECECVECE
jgi:hypothetical protein